MNVDEIRNYCIIKKGVTEGFPFDSDTLVFKVMNKMFLLMSLEKTPLSFNVKCDPELALELREEFECVLPGYHMNKTHWNTIVVDGSMTEEMLKKQIDNSYDLIVESLPKKLKEELNG